MTTYTPEPTTSLEAACLCAANIANCEGKHIRFCFNGWVAIVGPESDPEELGNAYMARDVSTLTMTTQTNTTTGGLSPRLEIASRVLAALYVKGGGPEESAEAALAYADALLAADAESRKEGPAKVFDVDIVELRRELLSLRAELARVTKERDEARHDMSVARANERVLHTEAEQLRGLLAASDREQVALRDQLAAAIAPLPEEEGLVELDEHDVSRCLDPKCRWTMTDLLARHALASNARCKARKAREEGRKA